jgi:hypothetical protein
LNVPAAGRIVGVVVVLVFLAFVVVGLIVTADP